MVEAVEVLEVQESNILFKESWFLRFFFVIMKLVNKMEEVKVKTILTKTKNSQYWFGNDYNMNLYRGCSHGCIYCDSRSSCYQINEFDRVRVKKDAIKILSKELISKRNKGVVGIGAMSDTYNPYEKHLNITRQALQLLDQYYFGVSLETKSDLITRDIDIFQKINKHSDVILKMTITCYQDELSKIIEPHVCGSSRRFHAIKQLSDAGLFCGVLMTPILPFINDNEKNIKEIVRMSYESGAKFIYTYFGMTLRENQRDHYYQKLDEYFPGLKEKYMKRYGQRYDCESQNINQLRYVFINECEKYGLLYNMNDIIKAYKFHDKKVEQLTLF